MQNKISLLSLMFKITITSASYVNISTSAGVGRCGWSDSFKKKVTIEKHAAEAFVPEVGIRRDYGEIQSAGMYFSGRAFIKRPAEGDEIELGNLEIPFVENHQTKLSHMDSFLMTDTNSHPKWLRNHLAADLFTIVFDARKEKIKLLEGTLQVRKELAPDGEYTFAIRDGNSLISGYKFADFVSDLVISSTIDVMGANADNYEFINTIALKPVTDPSNNHGDRQALDTIKTNPHLFFNLMRREGHREDLKILSMGIRYSSSYDACKGCFEKIYDARNSFNSTLYSISSMQGYSIHESVTVTSEIPTYNLFYSMRPYFKKGSKTTNVTAYWRSSTEEIRTEETNVKYKPKYHLDLSTVPEVDKPLLNIPKKTIHIEGDVFLQPDKVYHNCKFLTEPAVVQYKL